MARNIPKNAPEIISNRREIALTRNNSDENGRNSHRRRQIHYKQRQYSLPCPILPCFTLNTWLNQALTSENTNFYTVKSGFNSIYGFARQSQVLTLDTNFTWQSQALTWNTNFSRRSLALTWNTNFTRGSQALTLDTNFTRGSQALTLNTNSTRQSRALTLNTNFTWQGSSTTLIWQRVEFATWRWTRLIHIQLYIFLCFFILLYAFVYIPYVYIQILCVFIYAIYACIYILMHLYTFSYIYIRILWIFIYILLNFFWILHRKSYRTEEKSHQMTNYSD